MKSLSSVSRRLSSASSSSSSRLRRPSAPASSGVLPLRAGAGGAAIRGSESAVGSSTVGRRTGLRTASTSSTPTQAASLPTSPAGWPATPASEWSSPPFRKHATAAASTPGDSLAASVTAAHAAASTSAHAAPLPSAGAPHFRPGLRASPSRSAHQPASAPRRLTSSAPRHRTRATPGAPAPTPPTPARIRRLDLEHRWTGTTETSDRPSPHVHLADTPATLVFPGSGSQYVGMGEFLHALSPAADAVWDEALGALSGFESWLDGLCLADRGGRAAQIGRILAQTRGARLREPSLRYTVYEGPQRALMLAQNAQPAILVTSIALLRTVEARFVPGLSARARCAIGHSSGEYSAAVAAGAFSLADAVRLVRLHGLASAAVPALPGSALTSGGIMSAVLLNPGHTHREVEEIVASIPERVQIASYNSPSQLVLAGSREGVYRAADALSLQEIAVHAADLPVSAPFHCSFMSPVGDVMRIALEDHVSDPTIPIISCVDGSVITRASELGQKLVEQISSPVRWTHVLGARATDEDLVFFGPGRVLSNLSRGQDVHSVTSIATPSDFA